ncbi:armadillo repeat protein deleted in velo-cardio-facial syndrome isoform X6, partial [Clarias magur]
CVSGWICADGSHEDLRRYPGVSLQAEEQSPSNQTSLAMMQEPQEVVEETVTIEEDPGTPTSHVSV